MALDSSIPLQSNAPDPTTSLSAMLDMGQKSLSLAKSRANFDSDIARNKAETSQAQSKSTVDQANIQPSIDQQAAQTSTAQSNAAVNKANVGPLIQQQAANTSTAQTGADSSQFELNQKKTQAAQQGMMELVQDPNINNPDPATYNHEQAIHTVANVRDFMIANGQDKSKVEAISARLIAAAGQPGGISNIMRQQIRAGLTPSQNISASTPQGVQVTDNRTSYNADMNPMSQNGIGSRVPGTTTDKLLSRSEQQTTGADKNGNPIVLNRNPQGQNTAPQSMPGSNAPPLISYPPGESEGTRKVYESESLDAKNSMLKATEMHANNKGILSALDEVISTGATGKFVAKYASAAGTMYNEAEKAASAYDTIGKLSEKNALAAAAAMGTGTNAQLEAQIKANGSAAYNPTALRSIVKLNDAIVTGQEKYAVGLDKNIQANGHVFGKKQFDMQWAQNANVDTLKFLNAIKMGDKTDQADVIKSVGGVESKDGHRIIQQLKNLQKLTQTGHL